MNIKSIHFLKSFLLLGSIISLLVFIVSFWKNHTQDSPRNSLAFVLDVSESMNVEDIEGSSRLKTAKNIITQTMLSSAGWEFSLTIFAGETLRVLPFTQDLSLVQTFLSGIDSTNISQQGTHIDLALEEALENFIDEKQGTIILLTDGADENTKLSVQLQQKIQEKNIEMQIVWVGSEAGGYIPTGDIFSPYKMYRWETVVSRLNEQALLELARELDGKYVSFSEALSLEALSSSNTSLPPLFLFVSFLFWIAFLGIFVFEIYKK